jgi:hypothetical protein
MACVFIVAPERIGSGGGEPSKIELRQYVVTRRRPVAL